MNDTKQTTIIHIGYPKAASSYLKRDYFASLTSNVIIPRSALLDTIRNPSEPADLQNAILQNVRNKNEPIIISNENLSGTSFWSLDSALDVCRNFYMAFPNAKVIIVIREQRSYLLSAYKYSIYTGHYIEPFAKFFKKNKITILEKLQYHKIIKAYVDLFGSENVCVLPAEMLKEDEKGFYDILSTFTGLVKSQSGISPVRNIGPKNWDYIEFIRKANMVLKYIASAERAFRRLYINNSLAWDGHKIIVYRLIVDNLAKFFDNGSYQGEIFDQKSTDIIAMSNRLTEDAISRSLKRYNYL